jgi:hypothetical protein
LEYANLLLESVGKPGASYYEPESITQALGNLKELIDKWAIAIGADTLGERSRTPWDLCQVLNPNLGKPLEITKADIADNSAGNDVNEI